MAEQLFTIPVNEAFTADCECPLCSMYESIEKNALNFVMGSGYMDADVRSDTDRAGFCQRHVKLVYDLNNRLGMAWVMKTHMDKLNRDLAKLTSNKHKNTKMIEYISKMNNSCYVCNRVNPTFDRYVATIFHLWKHDDDFIEKYKKSKGFCMNHYGMLIKAADSELGGKQQELFLSITNQIFIDNMNRVRDDVAWFINKFDYKYKEEPWKEAKDSLPRAMEKVNSIYYMRENKE